MLESSAMVKMAAKQSQNGFLILVPHERLHGTIGILEHGLKIEMLHDDAIRSILTGAACIPVHSAQTDSMTSEARLHIERQSCNSFQHLLVGRELQDG